MISQIDIDAFMPDNIITEEKKIKVSPDILADALMFYMNSNKTLFGGNRAISIENVRLGMSGNTVAFYTQVKHATRETDA
jgi:hypothetical protein